MLSLREKLERESGMQYGLTHILHTARACGNPQLRQRYLFVAHRVPFGVEPPHLEYLPMVQDAIDDLRDLPEQWEDQPIVRPAFSSYATALRRSDGLGDGHIGLNNTNSNRVKDVLAAVEWSEGELQNVVVKRMHDAGMELPPVWERRRDHFVRNGFNMGFHQPSRLRRNHTAPVCTGAAMDHFVHYAEDRLLTHREICRLMGYPDDWRVEPLRDSKGLRQTWGKGVTVQVGQWIGPWLKAALDGNPGSMTGELIGDRERLINVKAAWKTASKVA
jgi:site-specific DNA-cytosine methylase